MTTSAERLSESPLLAGGAGFYRQALSSVGQLYCRVFHHAISRPVDGKYRCWKCLREFELDW